MENAIEIGSVKRALPVNEKGPVRKRKTGLYFDSRVGNLLNKQYYP